jgi:5-bromo-4-chloroindolyl phosphate hydrolysis protein
MRTTICFPEQFFAVSEFFFRHIATLLNLFSLAFDAFVVEPPPRIAPLGV